MNDDYGELVMEISADIEKELTEYFNIEIEMLQAERKPMCDGRTEISLKIYDKQKCEMIKEFLLKCISKSIDKNLN
jgi:hypothetical protein